MTTTMTIPRGSELRNLLMTATEAADLTGVERHTVSRWIREGKIEATRFGSVTLLVRASVEALVVAREERQSYWRYGRRGAKK